MRRFKHNLSHYNLLSCNMGRLIPVMLEEVLPGDVFRHQTAALIRVSPLVAPVMHPVTIRFHSWFVPHRIVWPQSENGGWEEFITGGPNGDNAEKVPSNTMTAAGPTTGSILDYYGLPAGQGDYEYSNLPLRGYAAIFNEWYRDQDLTNPIDWSIIDEGRLPFAISWEKDYFTASRPVTQKGPDISLPIGKEAPVKGIGKTTSVYPDANAQALETGGTGPVTYTTSAEMDGDTGNTQFRVQQDPNNPGFPGIFADLTSATAATVNEVRQAFALQRYQEARARYGSRYTEYLKYLGVTPADSRLQRPEYLGGGKSTITFSEVLQTAEDGTNNNPLGRLGGHGISAVRTRPYVRHFNEHGYVHTFMSVRPKTMYQNGVDRTWLKEDKEEFFQRELQFIGQQEIWEQEIYASGQLSSKPVWGYQDRYDEYKRHRSGIRGEFRNLLNYWHMGRIFATPPVLNESFVLCDPTKRIHADQTSDSLWCQVHHNLVARRPVLKSRASKIL